MQPGPPRRRGPDVGHPSSIGARAADSRGNTGMDSGGPTRVPGYITFMRMMAIALKVIGMLAAAYLVVVAVAWAMQTRMVFPAPRGPLPSPASRGFPDGERIAVTTSDGVRLFGWYLPPNPAPLPGATAPGLIWFYGNMETVEGIAPMILALRPDGVAVLILDYRGYGQSDGKPSEAGVYRDGEAAWEALTSRPEIDAGRVAVYGRSVGSTIAIHVAVHRPVRAVILDSPFSTGRAMAAYHYWWLPTSLMRMSLDNIGQARKLTQPLMVFHGGEDRIVPIQMGRAVAQAGRAEDLVVIPGAGHNDTFTIGGELYREKFNEFLAAHLTH